MICDAHTHIKIKDLKYLCDNEIYSMACAMNPEESKELIENTADCKYVNPTCAIHPNYSDRYEVSEMMPYFDKVKVIGEIGMDDVWCTVPLVDQRTAFLKQLNIAEETNKPVIIHSKGMERLVADILKNYSMPKIIHWYSSLNYLELYFKMDCYFTIGPGILSGDESVINLVKRLPLNRLLVETDGIEAINWALGKEADIDITKDTLLMMCQKISSIKNEPIELVNENIEKNFLTFF